MNLASILSKLGISTSLTQDITLLIVLILISVVLAIFVGKSKLVYILVGSYISAAIASAVPAGYFSDYSYKIIAFLAIIVAMALWGKKLVDVNFAGIGSGFMWKILTLSFLEVALIISVIISYMPKKAALVYVSPSSYGYLVNDPMKLVWLALPLLFLLFFQRSK
jgi:hypothetical protein